MATRAEQITALQHDWETNPRWAGVTRTYTAEDVVRLRGSLQVEHTLAKRGAVKLWEMVSKAPFVSALGAQTDGQALQQVKAGLKAIHLSSIDSADPVPLLVRRINNSFQRADQVQWSEGKDDIDYFAPIVADANAGFGGALNAFEQMKSMIEAGASGVHFQDSQMGGKVLLPTREVLASLTAARLAADVMGAATLVIARTDAGVASLLATDIDDNDKPFCTGERTVEGYYKVRNGLEQSIARALAYAPYADLVWCETGKPDLVAAKAFADAVHERFPGKLLAYNCSPSFNWKKNFDDATIARFQKELGAMGYKFQFIALAGSRSLNYGMFQLAHGYARRQMSAFVELQEAEFAAAMHQREACTSYFDAVTAALQGSIEVAQFPACRAA